MYEKEYWVEAVKKGVLISLPSNGTQRSKSPHPSVFVLNITLTYTYF